MNSIAGLIGDKGTYAKLVPDETTKQRIATLTNQINLQNAASVNSLHVTVVYSKKGCYGISNIDAQLPIKADGVGFDLFNNPDGSKCLVLLLDSPAIHQLHRVCHDMYGAVYDYPSYKPHITLSYDYSSALPNASLLEFFKNLTFDQYKVEALIS